MTSYRGWDQSVGGVATHTSGQAAPTSAPVGSTHRFTGGVFAGRTALYTPSGWVFAESLPVAANPNDPFFEYPYAMTRSGGWYTLFDPDNEGIADYFGNVYPTFGANVNTQPRVAAVYANSGYATLPGGTANGGEWAILYSPEAQASMEVGHSFVDFFTVNGAATGTTASMWGSRDGSDAKDWMRVVAIATSGAVRLEANSAIDGKVTAADTGTNVYNGTNKHLCITFDYASKLMSLFAAGALIKSQDMSSLEFSETVMDHALGGVGGGRGGIAHLNAQFKNYGRLYYGAQALPGPALEIAESLAAFQAGSNADSRPPKQTEIPFRWR